GPPISDGSSASLLIGGGPPPPAIRGRRAVASALERPEEFALDAGADPRRAIGKDDPADDLSAFVRRSMLDAYGTADRLARMSAAHDDPRYPGRGLVKHLQ